MPASDGKLPGRSPGQSRCRVALALMLCAPLVVAAGLGARAAPRQAVVLEIDGPIGPAVAEYVAHGIDEADPDTAGVIVLRMDTPGGLDSAMRAIIRSILDSRVPVVSFVAPGGARAASAGTYIAYASAVAAMAPGTNLGAATPIRMGGLPTNPEGREKPAAGDGAKGGGTSQGGKDEAPASPDDAESRKVLNDAVAYIRSLAELHGRNVEWAESAVRGAASLSAEAALERHVVDVIAGDVPDLLRKIDGRQVSVHGKPVRLATSGLEILPHPPGWRTRLLAVITDPNIAYLLMLLGAYGLIFELANPGAVLPGIIGAISLLVAMFALNLLPVDFAGAGLVLLGIALMVAEAFVASFGVLGIGGIAAFAIGSIIMFRGDAPSFRLSPWVVGAATAVTAGLFILVLAMLVRSRRGKVVTGDTALVGTVGEIVDWQSRQGRVRVRGELWQARAAAPLPPGSPIRVVAREGLVLIVEGAGAVTQH